MRKRLSRWLLMTAMTMPIMTVGCPTNIALQALDSAVQGVLISVQGWAIDATTNLLTP